MLFKYTSNPSLQNGDKYIPLYIPIYSLYIFLEQEVSGNLGKKVWRMDDRRKTGFKAMQEIGLNKAMDFMKT